MYSTMMAYPSSQICYFKWSLELLGQNKSWNILLEAFRPFSFDQGAAQKYFFLSYHYWPECNKLRFLTSFFITPGLKSRCLIVNVYDSMTVNYGTTKTTLTKLDEVNGAGGLLGFYPDTHDDFITISMSTPSLEAIIHVLSFCCKEIHHPISSIR